MLVRDLDHDLAQLRQVGAVGHAKRYAEPNTGIFIAPVGHPLRDEVGVRHNDRHIVIGNDRGAAQVDFAHLAGHTTNLDTIPNGDGPFRQDNQATDEIADDVLQAKPKTDAHGARDDRQRTQVDADHLQADVESQREQGITGYASQGELQRRLEVRPPQQAGDEVAAEDPFP